MFDAWKMFQTYSPKWWDLIVIYHGTIRNKNTLSKQIQVTGVLQHEYQIHPRSSTAPTNHFSKVGAVKNFRGCAIFKSQLASGQ